MLGPMQLGPPRTDPAADPAQVAAALKILNDLLGRVGAIPSPMPDNLTVDEAAGELKCSRDTVTRLIESGRLPAKDLGHGKHHNYRVRRQDLELLNVPVPR